MSNEKAHEQGVKTQQRSINMESTTTRKNNENEIRDLLDNFSKAVEARDFDAIEAAYTDEVTVFDVPPPLRSIGKATYRKLWEGWLGMFDGNVKCEIRELKVAAADDVAYAHFLSKISNVGSDGTEHGSWVRVSLGFTKTNDKWLVAHAHASLPFNGETSVEDLQP